ncbi:MAG: extracellular solute-binding protein [Chloroflexi bacterium]|nr:extracellular solute-binding protein [Chloroflexota bacterium]
MQRLFRKNKTWLLVVVLVTILGLVLAACQPAAPAPAAQPQSGSEAPVAAAKAPVVLKFLKFADPVEAIAFAKIEEEFRKLDGGKWSHVSIAYDTVDFQDLFPKIETSVAAGVELDLIQADGPDMKHYAWNQVLIPLDEYFTAEEKAAFAPQSIEEGSYKGLFYGPPFMQSCSLMWYNQEMTDAAGIQPPQELADSWTMDEALDAWQKTTVDNDGDGTPDVWGVRWGQGTWAGDYEQGILRRSAGEVGSPTYEGMGPDGITFQGYFDTPEAIESMQFYQDMHQTWKVTPVEAIPNIFQSKKAAFVVFPDNIIGDINNQYPDGGFALGVTGIPYFKSQLCHTGSWHYGISANTKHFDETLAFVKFASSKEGSRIYYEALRQLPARLDLLNELSEYNSYPQSLIKQGFEQFGIPRIQTPGYTEYQQVFAEITQNIAAGADVAQQMTDGAKQIEQLVAKYKGWNE